VTTSEAASFLVLARDELGAAKLLLRAHHGRQASFHLQQAAERLIQAVLTAEGIGFARTHQLGTMAALLPEDHSWRADVAALDDLTSHATAYRFPLPSGGVPVAPDERELAAAVDRLALLLEAVDEWCQSRQAG
jgi:HEPN domain-containing protein